MLVTIPGRSGLLVCVRLAAGASRSDCADFDVLVLAGPPLFFGLLAAGVHDESAVEPEDGDDDPEPLSADATPCPVAMAVPTPSATASAPIRPMNFEPPIAFSFEGLIARCYTHPFASVDTSANINSATGGNWSNARMRRQIIA